MKSLMVVVVGMFVACSGDKPPGAGPASGGAGGSQVTGGAIGADAGGTGTGGIAGETGGRGGYGGTMGGTDGAIGGSGGNGIQQVQQALSGTRLKAYWHTAADGSKQFANKWFDSLLNLDCTVRGAPDAKYRCLPAFEVTGDFFTDQGCMTPLVAFSTQVAACTNMSSVGVVGQSQFASVRGPDPARCAVSINRIGAAYSGTIYTRNGPSCVALPPNQYPQEYHEVGPALDLNMFADMTPVHD